MNKPGERGDDGARAAAPRPPWAVWLLLLVTACTSAECQRAADAFVAVAVVAMVGALVVMAIAALLFFVSLVLLIMNLARPSWVSVIGAGAFAGLFLVGGGVQGVALIASATEAQAALVGAGWLTLHVLYAGGLIASSVFGYQRLQREQAQRPPQG